MTQYVLVLDVTNCVYAPQGAVIDPLNRGDWTPLMLAATKEGQSAVQVALALLERGANDSLHNKVRKPTSQ